MSAASRLPAQTLGLESSRMLYGWQMSQNLIARIESLDIAFKPPNRAVLAIEISVSANFKRTLHHCSKEAERFVRGKLYSIFTLFY
jgi:hypothetical protein